MTRELDRGTLNARHRAAYDALAGRYAVVNEAMPAAVLASARQFRAAVTAGEGDGVPVLDLGCGHGRDAVWFEAQGLRLVGADLSGGMLAQARDRVRGPLVAADMRCLPLGDGAFRGVWCNAALLHLPKEHVPGALREVWRVLAAGGIFYAAIKVGEGEGWEAQSYDHPVARFFARYAVLEFAALLDAAGFEVLDTGENDGVAGCRWAHFLTRKLGGSA